jgi:hypothetical protein
MNGLKQEIKAITEQNKSAPEQRRAEIAAIMKQVF